jgi:hypothetical protein
MEKIKAVGALVATLLTGAIVIWWLVIVASKIGVKPVVENGNVVLDEWERSKDILIIVLPLFSAALAFWVGGQGEAAAKQEAEGAKQQLEAVIDVSPEGILKKAKSEHPEAFEG